MFSVNFAKLGFALLRPRDAPSYYLSQYWLRVWKMRNISWYILCGNINVSEHLYFSVLWPRDISILVNIGSGTYLNQCWLNSLAPGKFEWNFRHVIFKQIWVIGGWGISCEIALVWMSLDFTDDQSTLVQVIAWCRQATSHYLSQCWHRSMSPYGVTRPQWVINIRPQGTNCNKIRTQNHSINNDKNAFENVICWMSAILIRPQYVNFLTKRRLASTCMIELLVLVVINNMVSFVRSPRSLVSIFITPFSSWDNTTQILVLYLGLQGIVNYHK